MYLLIPLVSIILLFVGAVFPRQGFVDGSRYEQPCAQGQKGGMIEVTNPKLFQIFVFTMIVYHFSSFLRQENSGKCPFLTFQPFQKLLDLVFL